MSPNQRGSLTSVSGALESNSGYSQGWACSKKYLLKGP